MKKMGKKAFTLIELIVVIAVVGMLVLLSVPRFTGYTQRAELTRIQHDIKMMEQEIGTVLINNDDDFNNWEDNNKDFNQLIQEGKLFEKEGPVKKVDARHLESTNKTSLNVGGELHSISELTEDLSIDETYKVIPEEYKDKINTKLKGTFYANSHGKVYYEHTKPLSGITTEPTEPSEPGEKEPEYSDEEIQDLKNKGFIPVATAEDLNSIRNNTERIYGAGTKWEGLYTGGLNKQYIQVANIDLSEYSGSGWTPIGTYSSSFTGTYDGGNYVIKGLEVKGKGKEDQGLFGVIVGATIRNVGLENVNITGTEYVGGLAGMAADNSTISNSYATGEVAGSSNIGGLVGVADNSTIRNSYATGEVAGSSNIGGLVGLAHNSTISNSYATGEVAGSHFVGGLVGEAAGVSTTISNSYAKDEVTGSYYVGGLVGKADSITIDNSYATGSVKRTKDNLGGRMEGQGDYVGGLVGGAHNSTTISNSYATGLVSGGDEVSTYVGGLIGRASDSTIEKSYATGSVTGGIQVGGLVGISGDSTIDKSYSKGSVTGGGYVGGLVGEANAADNISNSYATGEVEGIEVVGGLVGKTDWGTNINKSYATGSVTGEHNIGGLVGRVNSSTNIESPAISNSYATGKVEGTSGVGGLVGSAEGDTFGDLFENTTISNSYATGSVIGTSDVGGLLGRDKGSTIENSYWDKETTGRPTSSGEGEGKTTDEMKKADTYAAWGTDVWNIVNGEYPTLKNSH